MEGNVIPDGATIMGGKELKETVSEVFNSILEDDDDELKDTLNDVFNSVRK